MSCEAETETTGVDISILVPVFRHEAFVEACLQSVFDQTHPASRIELLICDDASPDGSAEVVRRFLEDRRACVARLDRVTFDALAQNVGLARNLRGLVERARGKWLLPVASDDVLEATLVERVLTEAARQDTAMVFSNARCFGNGADRLLYPERVRSGVWKGGRELKPDAVRAYRRDVLARFPLPPDLAAEGIWLVAHALASGDCRYLAEPLFRYRIHDGNTSLRGQRLALEAYRRQSEQALSDLALTRASLEAAGLFDGAAARFVIDRERRQRARRLAAEESGLLAKLWSCASGRRTELSATTVAADHVILRRRGRR